MPLPSQPLRQVRFGDFELDLQTAELRNDGQRFTLQDQPFQILALLLEQPGRLISREELKKRLWPSDAFGDFDHGLNKAINRLRDTLGDSADHPRFIETLPRKGYRFVAPVQDLGAAPAPGPPTRVATEEVQAAARSGGVSRGRIYIVAVVLVTSIGLATYLHSHRVQALTEKDTIVLADFINNTGDPVFDDTLKQALSVELSQSPRLNILSEESVAETLQSMGRTVDEQVSEKTALEVCQRRQSAAVLAGSIARLGSQYVIGLNLMTCRTGDALIKEQLTARSKEEVLRAVDLAATKLREKLGESLSSIEKFGVPIEQATTPSLEALQAYSLGCRNLMAGNMVAALPAFRNAVSIDPNFAIAYARLGVVYANLGEFTLATVNTKKAYELRQGVSERERFYIESHYHMFVTGSIEKGTEVFELWEQVYPQDVVPPYNLGATYADIGQFDKALDETQKALRLDPGSALNHGTLAYMYLNLNRFEEARATAEQAVAQKLDPPGLHATMYAIASAQNDEDEMQRQLAWAAGKHGVEDILLAAAADTAAYAGRLTTARELSHRAMVSAQEADKKEACAAYQAGSAVRESLFGNEAAVRPQIRAAVQVSKSADILFMAALARARSGDITGAQAAALKMAKRFPEDSIVQFVYLPTARAQIAIRQGNSTNAIEILRTAFPYELGSGATPLPLFPVYLRGEAYLELRRGAEAAGEFQKILDHRGVVLRASIGALAHLQLGRAYRLEGDTPKARDAYQDFLELWKDADPDIPVLKQAKSEYAQLAL